MKPARWHVHRVTGARIFGRELEVGDRTQPGDVYESNVWRRTASPGETLPAIAVAATRYVRPTATPAEELGITLVEIAALVCAAADSGSPELASLLDRLSPGSDAIAVRRGRR